MPKRITDLSLRVKDVKSENNNVKISLKGESFDADAVLHTAKNDYAKIKGIVNYGKKKYVDISVEAKDVKLENFVKLTGETVKILNIKNPFEDIKITGVADADFKVKSDFKTMTSTGKAKITKGVISHKSFPYSVNDINEKISLFFGCVFCRRMI